MSWEILEKPGEKLKPFSLKGDEAIELLNEAIAAAKKAKISWEDEPIELVPQSKLVELIRLSQLEATKEES